jgi:hypothetical protein
MLEEGVRRRRLFKQRAVPRLVARKGRREIRGRCCVDGGTDPDLGSRYERQLRVTDPQMVVPVLQAALALDRQVDARDPGGIDRDGAAVRANLEREPVLVQDVQPIALDTELRRDLTGLDDMMVVRALTSRATRSRKLRPPLGVRSRQATWTSSTPFSSQMRCSIRNPLTANCQTGTRPSRWNDSMWTCPAGDTAPPAQRLVKSGHSRSPSKRVASALAKTRKRPSGGASGAMSSPW